MQCPELVVGESKQGHKCCINFHWGNEKGPLLLIRLEREKNDHLFINHNVTNSKISVVIVWVQYWTNETCLILIYQIAFMCT